MPCCLEQVQGCWNRQQAALSCLCQAPSSPTQAGPFSSHPGNLVWWVCTQCPLCSWGAPEEQTSETFAPSEDILQPAALWCDLAVCWGSPICRAPLSRGPWQRSRGGDALCWLCSLSLAALNSVGKLAVDSWTCSSSAAWGKGRTRSFCICSAESLEAAVFAVSSTRPSSCSSISIPSQGKH